MLVDEEELREFRVVARHQQEPGRGQHQVDRQSRERVQALPRAGVARRQRVQDQRRAGYHQSHQSLGQRRAGGRRVGDEHPVAAGGARAVHRAGPAGTRTTPRRATRPARCRASATATARNARSSPPAPAPHTPRPWSPSRRAAVMPTIATAISPASAGTSRAVHSRTPNALKAAAVAQYWNGGFSKYLRPFRRGVTQSPDAAISRAISAYRPSSGCCSLRTAIPENQATSSTAAMSHQAERGREASMASGGMGARRPGGAGDREGPRILPCRIAAAGRAAWRAGGPVASQWGSRITSNARKG